jgi:putative membrane protein
MATFGFGMIGFYRTLEEKSGSARSAQLHQGAIKFGAALVVLGIAATVLSGMSHWFSLRRLRGRQYLVIARWPLSITVAMLLSVLGLSGLWFALAH